MAITHVASTSTSVSGTTVSINVPTGTADNDVLVLAILHSFAAGLGGVSALTGWDLLWQGTNQAYFIRVAASEPASYDPAWTTTGNTVVIMHAYRGVDTTDPILAFQHQINGTSTAPPVPKAWFNACDYMAVTFVNMGRSVLTFTAPTGYTLAGSQNPSGGTTNASTRGAGAYKSFTATQNAAATAWASGNGAISEASHLILRGTGVDVLAMRNFQTIAQGAGTTHTASAPATYKVGTLLVVSISWKVASATVAAITGPTGWTQKGTTQTVGSNPTFGMALFYKVAAGGDSLAFTFDNAISYGHSYTQAFDGPTGTVSALPGTVGQDNDNTATLDLVVPAMGALDDYTDDVLLFAAAHTSRGDRTLTAPAGFTHLSGLFETGNANFMNSAIAVKTETGGTPAATSFTLESTDTGQAFQWAVGGAASAPAAGYSFGLVIG